MNHLRILAVLTIVGVASIQVDRYFPGRVPSPPGWLIAWAGWMFYALAVLALTTNIRGFVQRLQSSKPWPIVMIFGIAIAAYVVNRFWLDVPPPAPWLLAWAGWTATMLALLRPEKVGEVIQALQSELPSSVRGPRAARPPGTS
jgi:hypothetical protein